MKNFNLTKCHVALCFFFCVATLIVESKKDEKQHQQVDPHRFNYEVENREDGPHQYRSDDSDNTWNMKGTYGFRKPSGEYRIVDYLADEYGFSANVKSNDPGIVSPSSTPEAVVRSESNNDDKWSSSSSSGSQSKINQLKLMVQNMKNRQQEEDNGEDIEQKPERLSREEETTTTILSTPTTTTTPPSSSIPSIVAKALGRDSMIEREESQPSAPQASNSNQGSNRDSNSINSDSINNSRTFKEMKTRTLANKLSIHQLIAEAMPSLQMSVVPVYFYNKASKSLVAVPYLIMKSVSKMPLLPSMLESGLSSSITPPTSAINGNLLNFIHSPSSHQPQRSRPLNFLSSFHNDYLNNEGHGNGLNRQHLLESETNDNGGSTWVPINGNGHSHGSNFWKK
ncbi:uncharacterized protein LOC141857629 [Brevipalpus obovatus]|uniref:uncharacterized protein LOC141857629 n=1 Tax=Brevipalpus obovatus TaxID=246614 RepID=UPI003D9E1A41